MELAKHFGLDSDTKFTPTVEVAQQSPRPPFKLHPSFPRNPIIQGECSPLYRLRTRLDQFRLWTASSDDPVHENFVRKLAKTGFASQCNPFPSTPHRVQETLGLSALVPSSAGKRCPQFDFGILHHF